MRSADRLPDVRDADHISPDLEDETARSTMFGGSQVMAAKLQVNADRVVSGKEALSVAG